MSNETISDVEAVLQFILSDREISNIMYRRVLPDGSPMLGKYRDVVRNAVAGLRELVALQSRAEPGAEPKAAPTGLLTGLV